MAAAYTCPTCGDKAGRTFCTGGVGSTSVGSVALAGCCAAAMAANGLPLLLAAASPGAAPAFRMARSDCIGD